MRTEKIILPWPNSDNDHHQPIVRRIKGKMVPGIALTETAKSYRTLVKMILGIRQPDRRWDCRLDIKIDLYPPRRGCDTNNYWKSLQDALTHAGVWRDDVLAVGSAAERHDAVGKAKANVVVVITERV